MSASARTFLFLGSLNMGLAVALGALGAHGLRSRLSPEMMAIYHTAVEYHFYHAGGLLIVGLAAPRLRAVACVNWAGWLMFAGIVVFSGSLYLLSLSGMRWLGAITPLGGMAFIVAWGLLAVAALKSPSS